LFRSDTEHWITMYRQLSTRKYILSEEFLFPWISIDVLRGKKLPHHSVDKLPFTLFIKRDTQNCCQGFPSYIVFLSITPAKILIPHIKDKKFSQLRVAKGRTLLWKLWHSCGKIIIVLQKDCCYSAACGLIKKNERGFFECIRWLWWFFCWLLRRFIIKFLQFIALNINRLHKKKLIEVCSIYVTYLYLLCSPYRQNITRQN